ncbi:heat shock protein HSP150 CYBJADRAFT_176929 [Cyberlindnera jadinii NRRL Y-1542]|uniref:Cell wall mannoprotein PIR1-like C-terminal domain-containing protein n=1 Tax=Cyberlindnera jadinii (strain ATCC 18201 / CBS 1600 / BCRC 20928 / JCM 3617 / NBRC 0987 / NRRL Y-1542) TaxID=983966 RepID=A0A1E4S5Z4_CYBJN|nr:hypothetical protein CYBJADRAFT_176929 [Cyberlindnera jadinii NRRL Y-1542]ODV74939.1 hypothetical protein CYBJADRAFT_176929 [Cyberlindnera jadinii NRRL Y-1542]
MQYKKSLLTSTFLASALASYIPSEPWTTLTPDEDYPSGAITDHLRTFGIAVQPITSASATATASVDKRDVVSQIGDGQIQATTATEAQVVSQIGDGQIQATTATEAQVVSQIGDGQIQATTATEAQVVSQIGDGQIQATTATAAQVVSQIGDGQIQATTATAAQVVSQIGDGQIQATTATEAQVVSQIGDGQIQATTATEAQVVSQIGDGQIQATTLTTAQAISQIGDGQIQATTSTVAAASQITDGQVQATSEVSDDDAENGQDTEGAEEDDYAFSYSCLTDSSLAMTLNGSILTDSRGRIGSIVANRQFQFDGPPPQAGAIYAAGWSITTDGYLALGDSDVFYQCLSGSFYNLYDESIGDQCTAIHLEIVDLITC